MTDKKKIFVIPAKESVPVRKPDGRYLSETGEDVVRTSFWLRRIKDGDVLLGDEAKKQQTKLVAAAKKAAAKNKGE